jgi:UDP-N-acetyl-D-glucosamine dehydrogenase
VAWVPTFPLDGSELKSVDLTEEELREADCVLILTDHPEFDYDAVARHGRLVLHTRQAVPETAGGRGHLVRL